ncbi:outer membrane beta-barrel protein [Dysgonomonas sp. ZJ709]|uniref:outer membrane beta-barrel protein n=1 Tax=Dysgonomonas sp. ZJ709 TaxID=2709797 RepID=UPI0013EDA407|nr:outer membrane beta-barrel protein [Dysgonomonas sp. ZJ709]
MRVKSFLIAIFISSLSIGFINAQSNFKQGYIITNDNDSLIGLIDFRTDKSNSNVCRFKESETSKVQTFYPSDIAKYRFVDEGKYYVSREIIIKDAPRKVFLEYLVQGMMNLYYYKDWDWTLESDSEMEYYFFENPDGVMMPVTKKPDEMVNYKKKEDGRYIGMLSSVFKDYPAITSHLDKTRFDRESMIGLAKDYHTITCAPGQECIEFENDYAKQFMEVKFSVYGGFQLLDYELHIPKGFSLMSSTYPVIGVQMNVLNPRWSKSFSFQVDFSLSGLKGESKGASEDFRKEYKLRALMIRGELGLKYTYPSGKFRPTLEAGLGYKGLFSSSAQFISKEYIDEDDEDFELYNSYKLPSFFIGYYCGVGADYLIGNEHSVFFRVTYNNYRNEDKMKLFQFKFGYTF